MKKPQREVTRKRPPIEPNPPVGINPKDLVGNLKIDTSLFPAVGVLHGAHAFADGAVKYGPYNWRENPVLSRVYIAAAQRHLLAWLDGEEKAGDSGVHHLGHVMACCAILLDAQEYGNLSDNRPPKGPASRVIDKLNADMKGKI